MDAIDRVAMNARLHYLGMAARITQPTLKLVVLTCMDARIDPSALLGLQPGDAHVLRNAGGRATTDALHALAVSQAVLGTEEVMVVHHTDCAMRRFTQSQLAEKIVAATNHEFHDELGVFGDDAEAVRVDVARIRSYPSLVHRDRVRGFLYDLATGALTEVAARPATPR